MRLSARFALTTLIAPNASWMREVSRLLATRLASARRRILGVDLTMTQAVGMPTSSTSTANQGSKAATITIPVSTP